MSDNTNSKDTKKKKKVYGKKETYTCAYDKCGKDFEARVADRNRGYARYCSRECAAQDKPPHYRGIGGGPTRHKRYKANKANDDSKGAEA